MIVMEANDQDAFAAALRTALDAMGLSLPPEVGDRCFAHYGLLVEANRQFNLTRITSPADAAVKHYADSLSLLTCEGRDSFRPTAVLDVGTGAGFPAVPLAIARPAWSIVAIDGTGKKVRFVQQSAAALGLGNLQARHVRAEQMAREQVGRFDLITVRAVGRIEALLADLAPLRKTGGEIVFYKTTRLDSDEQQAADRAASRLRLRTKVNRIDLPLGAEHLARQFIRYF